MATVAAQVDTMKRRTFLQVVGATATAAALPAVVPAQALVPVQTITISGLSPGSQVALFEVLADETLRTLYNGTVDKSELVVTTDGVEQIMVRTRKLGLLPFQGFAEPGDRITVVPTIDELVTTEFEA